LLVGDGSLRKKLEQLCVDLSVESGVKFFGFSTYPYALMVDSDLLVMSSDCEGLPIVSTDCPSGPRELLMDGKYGSLVPVNDKIALATAIEYDLNERRSAESRNLQYNAFYQV